MLHILFFRFFIQFSRSWAHRAPATSRSHLCLPHISSRAIRLSRCCSLFIHGLRVGGIPPLVGSNGLEPSTSRLSGVRSNHLSYEPISVAVRLPSGQTYLLGNVPTAVRDFQPHLAMSLKRDLAAATCRWWRRTESNCRPPACKAGALPAELRPHIRFVPG